MAAFVARPSPLARLASRRQIASTVLCSCAKTGVNSLQTEQCSPPSWSNKSRAFRTLVAAKNIGEQDGGVSKPYSTMAPIKVYSLATQNGQKIPIALEELGVEYEPVLVNIRIGDQFKPEFVAINPNSKIPAIIDPDGPDGKPITIFESGAILLYLAEKYGKLLPKDPAKKWEAIQWLFFQVGGVGPMTGQLAHFSMLSKEKMDHPYPKERYLTEVKRLLKVVDSQLEGKEFVVGEYSVADISLAPWIYSFRGMLASILDLAEYPNVVAWLDRIYARPAVQKGVKVNFVPW